MCPTYRPLNVEWQIGIISHKIAVCNHPSLNTSSRYYQLIVAIKEFHVSEFYGFWPKKLFSLIGLNVTNLQPARPTWIFLPVLLKYSYFVIIEGVYGITESTKNNELT